jgi:hypothetical protein
MNSFSVSVFVKVENFVHICRKRTKKTLECNGFAVETNVKAQI